MKYQSHFSTLKRLLGLTSLLWLSAQLAACSIATPESALLADFVYQGAIRISLAHPFDQSKDDYEVLVSVPLSATAVGLCEADKVALANCRPGVEGFHTSTLVFAKDHVKFFKMDESALLEDGLVVRIVALDAAGTIFDARNIKFVRSSPAAVQPQTVPGVVTPGVSPSIVTPGVVPAGGSTIPATVTPTAEAPALVQTYCGNCHANYAANPALLRSTGAKAMVESGSMPKTGVMPADAKAKLIQYLN